MYQVSSKLWDHFDIWWSNNRWLKKFLFLVHWVVCS